MVSHREPVDFDRLQLELEWLTRGMRAMRIARWGEGRTDEMAMKLKGLRDKAATFRSALDDVGQAYEEGTDAAKTHASEVRGLKDEFNDLKDDLDFAISTVGNSSAITGVNGAEKPKDEPKTPPTTPPANSLPPNPEHPVVRLGPNPSQHEDQPPSQQPGS